MNVQNTNQQNMYQQNGYGQQQQYGQQPQQAQQYGQPPPHQYGQPQASMYGQPAPQSGYAPQQSHPSSANGGTYMSQFDNVLQHELGSSSSAPSQYPMSYGANGTPQQATQTGYGQVNASWGNDVDSDGILPVVPLATQYKSASQSNSRRGSQDGGQPPINPNSFPTSHFPTSPVSALNQMQPMGHPNYTPSKQTNQLHQPQPIQPQGNIQHNISEFQGITAVSGSPSPPPTIAAPPTFQPPLNPLMPSSSGYPQPAQPNLNMGFPNPNPNTNAYHPHNTHTAAPKRVIDENSMNPTLSQPQPNPAFVSPQSPQQQQQPYGQPQMSAPMNSYGHSPATGNLSSPGRILSPAFNTGDQTVPSGNTMARPIQPPMPAQANAPQLQSQSHPAAPSASGLLPPPPPVSSYWKQRAATAAPDAVDPMSVGRVDYSDLDYKSMDFAYNNRYERETNTQPAYANTQAAPSQAQVPAQPNYGQPTNSYAPQQPAQSYAPAPGQPAYAMPQQNTPYNQPTQANYNPYAR